MSLAMMGRSESLRVRVTLACYVICFTIGVTTHGHDFLTYGWRPYRWGSVPLEMFWTSLILLDVSAVALLLIG